MKEFYYLEVNLICVIFLSFIGHKTANKRKTSLSEKLFRSSVFSAEVMCICDALCGLIDGKMFPGCIFLNYFINVFYFISGTFAALGWLLFVSIKIGKRMTRKYMYILAVPFFLISILMLTTPFTKLVFIITEENCYVRGPVIILQWVSIIFYLVHATFLSVRATLKEYNKILRSISLSYCYFGLFPLIAFILQILLPNITCTTVGVALGYLFYYIKSLENQISEDALTGLNNRKQLEKYVNDLIYRDPDAEIFVMMMDLNGFKLINDTYGHTTGDLALKDFADALRMACRKWRGHYMLCRYGGDEFAVVGEMSPHSDLNVFANLIRENVTEITVLKEREYSLKTSIGTVTGVCKKIEDFNHLYKEADKRMYVDKMRQKEGAQNR